MDDVHQTPISILVHREELDGASPRSTLNQGARNGVRSSRARSRTTSDTEIAVVIP